MVIYLLEHFINHHLKDRVKMRETIRREKERRKMKGSKSEERLIIILVTKCLSVQLHNGLEPISNLSPLFLSFNNPSLKMKICVRRRGE